MIDDPELLALFRDESDEHLQRLDEGLLRLEADPRDRATLEEVFRSAHSLKGASRMLGLEQVEALSHAFEDALSPAARGITPLSLLIIERCYAALDALHLLVREALTGVASGVEVERIVSQLQGREAAFTPATTLTDAAIPLPAAPDDLTPAIALPSETSANTRIINANTPTIGVNLPTIGVNASAIEVDSSAIGVNGPSIGLNASVIALEVEAPATETSAIVEAAPPGVLKKADNDSAWQIETIRVPPARLDALLSMAGELIVATTRAQRGRAELDDVLALWEEGGKLALAKDYVLRDLQRDLQRADVQHLGTNEALNSTPAQRQWRRLADRDHQRLERMGRALDKLRTTYDEMNRLSAVVAKMEEAIRGVRLLPLSTLFQQFPRTVRDLAKSGGKEVQLVIEGGDTRADKRILEELKDPLILREDRRRPL